MKSVLFKLSLLAFVLILGGIKSGYAQQQKLFIVTSCEVKTDIGVYMSEENQTEKNELESILLGQKMLVTKLEGIDGLSRVTRFKFSFLSQSFTLQNTNGMGGFKKFGADQFQLAKMNWNDREFNTIPSELLLYIKSNHENLGVITFYITAKFSSN